MQECLEKAENSLTAAIGIAQFYSVTTGQAFPSSAMIDRNRWLSRNMVFSQSRLGEPLYRLLMPTDVSHHVQPQPLHRRSSGISCSLFHQGGKPLFHLLQQRLLKTE